MININWQWPAGPGSKWAPWYVMAWRLLWVPVVITLSSLLVLAYFAMAGPKQARNVWEDIR